MKFFQSTVLFLFFSTIIFAQKSYLIHITIDKIVLGKDSVVFKKGKTSGRKGKVNSEEHNKKASESLKERWRLKKQSYE